MMWKQYASWIDELLNQVPMEHIIQVPKFPVEFRELNPYHVIIGKVPQGLRALYLIFRNVEDQYETLKVNSMAKGMISKKDLVMLEKLARVSNALGNLFWVSLRNILGILDLSEPIFVAGYWRVVISRKAADQLGIKDIPEFVVQHINDN